MVGKPFISAFTSTFTPTYPSHLHPSLPISSRRPSRISACESKPPKRYNNSFSSSTPANDCDETASSQIPPEPLSKKSSPSPKPIWRRVLEDEKYDDLRTFVSSFAIAIAFRALCVEPRFIPSESMLPTFRIGDQLLVEKVSKIVRPPSDGDIVVFQPPVALQQRGYGKSDAFIKRVVGQAGDVVRVQSGHLERNGEPIQEDFVDDPPKYDWGPATVPDGYVMVLGDNRNNSYDSHIWGFLPTKNIIGRAFVRYWPPTRFGSTILSKQQVNGPLRPDVAPLLQEPISK